MVPPESAPLRAQTTEFIMAGAFILATLAWLGVTAALAGGPFVYALDDPYINFALSRGLWQTGSLWINPAEPAAATSSPLWTLLFAPLAALNNTWVMVAGTSVVNWLAGVALVFLAGLVLRAGGVEAPWRRGLALGLYLLLLPVLILFAIGMEHLLHAAGCLALVVCCLRGEGDGALAPRGSALAAGLLAFLLPMIRYETAFILVGLGIALLLRRRWSLVGVLFVCSVAGAAVGALILKATSGTYLSLSVLTKAMGGAPQSLGGRVEHFLDTMQHPLNLGLVILNGALLLRPAVGERPLLQGIGVTFIMAMLLHGALAQFGWVERYEAYLLALGYLPVLCWLNGLVPERPGWPDALRLLAGLLLAGALGILFFGKVKANLQAFLVPIGIHGQQVQIGRFLRTLPELPGPVAMNDIGAAAWVSERPILDMVGLASAQAAAAKQARNAGPRRLALIQERQVPFVIIYPAWFEEEFLAALRPVARWRTRPAVIIGWEVTFYATSPQWEGVLEERLRAFEPELPSTTRAIYQVRSPDAP